MGTTEGRRQRYRRRLHERGIKEIMVALPAELVEAVDAQVGLIGANRGDVITQFLRAALQAPVERVMR